MFISLSLGLSEEQAALADAVARFLADEGLPRRGYEHADAARTEGWRELARLGVVGALAPEDCDGLGLGLADLVGVLVEMGRACFRGPYIATAVGATTALTGIGETDLLRRVAGGDQVLVLVDDEGVIADDAQLTGAVALVADAPAADVLLVAVRSGTGAQLYAVDATATGVDVQPVPTLDPSRSFGSVSLAGAPGRLLADDATDALASARDRVLAAHVADGLGAAATLFELAKEHALNRVQFDVPVATFQAVQHALVDVYATLEAGKVGVLEALRAGDDDAAQRHKSAVMAGAWCCDGFATVAATAIQVLGGIGFTWEHDAQLYYKRLMTLQTTYGGTPAHLAELAALTV